MANVKWLGAVLGSAAAMTVVSNSASIAPSPSMPVPPTITPTSGVNPVPVELGDPSDYILTNLGSNNPVIRWNGDAYHYLESHTSYLSLETITTTVNSQTSTMTSSVKVAVETAAAGDPNSQDGSTGILFSEDVADALRKTADSAIMACGLSKRGIIKRIDATTCLIDAAVQASGDGGHLEGLAKDGFWEQLPANPPQNAPQYLVDAINGLKSPAQKKKALVILDAILAGSKINGPIAAVNIPAEGVGEPETMCDPTKAATKESPLCQDDDCHGDDDTQRCTTGPEKGCPCLLLGVDATLQVYEQAWWDDQQAIIASVAADPGLLRTTTPSCSLNSAGKAFDGKPAATPASWCVCEGDGDGTMSIYPTVDTPSSPCAYTTLPTATISPMVTAASGEVTSCRTLTGTITGLYSMPPQPWTYCTCNDNSRHALATSTISGSTSIGCLTNSG